MVPRDIKVLQNSLRRRRVKNNDFEVFSSSLPTSVVSKNILKRRTYQQQWSLFDFGPETFTKPFFLLFQRKVCSRIFCKLTGIYAHIFECMRGRAGHNGAWGSMKNLLLIIYKNSIKKFCNIIHYMILHILEIKNLFLKLIKYKKYRTLNYVIIVSLIARFMFKKSAFLITNQKLVDNFNKNFENQSF